MPKHSCSRHELLIALTAANSFADIPELVMINSRLNKAERIYAAAVAQCPKFQYCLAGIRVSNEGGGRGHSVGVRG
jgi:hypothetical protein